MRGALPEQEQSQKGSGQQSPASGRQRADTQGRALCACLVQSPGGILAWERLPGTAVTLETNTQEGWHKSPQGRREGDNGTSGGPPDTLQFYSLPATLPQGEPRAPLSLSSPPGTPGSAETDPTLPASDGTGPELKQGGVRPSSRPATPPPPEPGGTSLWTRHGRLRSASRVDERVLRADTHTGL